MQQQEAAAHDEEDVKQLLHTILDNQTRMERRFDTVENQVGAVYLEYARIKKEAQLARSHGNAAQPLPLYASIDEEGEDDSEALVDVYLHRKPMLQQQGSATFSLQPHETTTNYWLCSHCSIQ
jgi:hypothetical protein